LTVKGYIAVSSAVGTIPNAMLLSGGTITIDVTDSVSGQLTSVSHQGDVLLQAVNVLGMDLMTAKHLRMAMNLGLIPPGVSLEV
jgi:hypothetical protein